MSPELFYAIAALWKLIFVLGFFTSVFIFRRPLVNLAERLTKFQLKRGDVELATEMLGVKIERESEAKTLPNPDEEIETKLISSGSTTESGEQVDKLDEKDSRGFFRVMFKAAFETRDIVETEEIFNKLQESTTDEEEKLADEAYYYFLRYDLGDPAAITKLTDMSKVEKAAPYANNALAFCYERSGDYDKARVFFEIASHGYAKKGSKQEHRVIKCVVKAAECLFEIGSKQEAYSLIMCQLAKTDNQLLLSNLYAGLASLYEQAGDLDLNALALEKAVEHKPNDVNLRFSAGLSYGKEKATHSLSLLHYKTLIQFNSKHGGALNNIGVQYNRLHLPMKAVQFYKQSISHNETLAAGNLANMYINAGFAEDARQVLDTAKQQPNIDPKVGTEISHLAEKEKAESEGEETQLKDAHEQQRFLQSFAEAYFVPTTFHRDFEGLWTAPDGNQITTIINGDAIQADWKIADTLEERFTGRISNRAAKIKYEHVWSSTTKDDRFGYAYLSPNGKELHILIMGMVVGDLATNSIEILKKNDTALAHVSED